MNWRQRKFLGAASRGKRLRGTLISVYSRTCRRLCPLHLHVQPLFGSAKTTTAFVGSSTKTRQQMGDDAPGTSESRPRRKRKTTQFFQHIGFLRSPACLPRFRAREVIHFADAAGHRLLQQGHLKHHYWTVPVPFRIKPGVIKYQSPMAFQYGLRGNRNSSDLENRHGGHVLCRKLSQSLLKKSSVRFTGHMVDMDRATFALSACAVQGNDYGGSVGQSLLGGGQNGPTSHARHVSASEDSTGYCHAWSD